MIDRRGRNISILISEMENAPKMPGVPDGL